MTIQAVIFDLDGTLLDTLQDIANAGNYALTQLGMPTHDPQAYRWFVGDGADVLVQRILPKDRQDLCADCLRHFKAYYKDHAAETTRVYPGMNGLLDGLVARKVQLAVLTNKPHPTAQTVISHYFPRWQWKAVHGHRDDVPKKPDPTAALAIARELKLEPAQIVFLGDSHVDMNTARNAGMIGIGAGWGFRTREELLESGAREVLEHPSELITVLKKY
jgi:phosphoglycolate phosphatase